MKPWVEVIALRSGGLAVFSVKRQAPRMGRNPRSGQSIAIPEQRVTYFKPGKVLREDLNGGERQE